MLSAAGNEQAVYVYVDLSGVEAQHAPQAGSEMTLKARLLSANACRTYVHTFALIHSSQLAAFATVRRGLSSITKAAHKHGLQLSLSALCLGK